jgi:hypothetical protein
MENPNTMLVVQKGSRNYFRSSFSENFLLMIWYMTIHLPLIIIPIMNWLNVLTEYPFYELAIILFLAAVLGALGQFLKQPLIVMFIFLGILVGPSVLDMVKSHDKIDLLAEVGIAVLLFIVGLKLDLRIIKSVGKVALINRNRADYFHLINRLFHWAGPGIFFFTQLLHCRCAHLFEHHYYCKTFIG